MRNKVTTKELINQRFSESQAEEIIQDAEKEAQTYWGGSRKGAGRKAKQECEVLKFTKRLTEKEVSFIDYARTHHLDYDKLMQ